MSNNKNWYVRQATKDDFKEMYEGQSPKNTIKAWCLVVDNHLIGIGGVMLVNFQYTVFCNIKPEHSVSNTVLYKAIKVGFENIKQLGVNFCAIRDEQTESSSRLLKHLGFDLLERRGGKEIYIHLN